MFSGRLWLILCRSLVHESTTGPVSTGCLPSAPTSSLSRSYGTLKTNNIPRNASQDTHRIENHMCYTWVYVTLRGSGLQVLIKHRCKLRNRAIKKHSCCWGVCFCWLGIFLSTWNLTEEGRGVCVPADVAMCVRLLSWPFTVQSISPRCITRDSASLSISLAARGDVTVRWWSTNQTLAFLLWELSLVSFYDFFISLLPPPACVSACRRPDDWPEARFTGFLPRSSCSVKVSPQPINRNPILMVVP